MIGSFTTQTPVSEAILFPAVHDLTNPAPEPLAHGRERRGDPQRDARGKQHPVGGRGDFIEE